MRNQGSSKQKWVERQRVSRPEMILHKSSLQSLPFPFSLLLLPLCPASPSGSQNTMMRCGVLCRLCNQKSLCNQVWGQWLCHLSSLLLRKCITDMGKERSHPFMSAPGWSCLLTALCSFPPLPPRWTFSASLALISK